MLPVAQWTWCVDIICGSGQTGRTSIKCSFVIKFMVCIVHKMLLKLPNEGKSWVGHTHEGGQGVLYRDLVGKDD